MHGRTRSTKIYCQKNRTWHAAFILKVDRKPLRKILPSQWNLSVERIHEWNPDTQKKWSLSISFSIPKHGFSSATTAYGDMFLEQVYFWIKLEILSIISGDNIKQKCLFMIGPTIVIYNNAVIIIYHTALLYLTMTCTHVLLNYYHLLLFIKPSSDSKWWACARTLGKFFISKYFRSQLLRSREKVSSRACRLCGVTSGFHDSCETVATKSELVIN